MRYLKPGKLLYLLFVVFLLACSGGQTMTNNLELRPLEQHRALELIIQTLNDNDITQTEINVPLKIQTSKEIHSDIYVESKKIAIEYLNEQDRRDYGELPPAIKGSDFHVIIARKENLPDDIYLLIVDDQEYKYWPNPDPENRNANLPTIYEVEDRLKQKIRDFLIAVRDLTHN